jgi:hypothetical protein
MTPTSLVEKKVVLPLLNHMAVLCKSYDDLYIAFPRNLFDEYYFNISSMNAPVIHKIKRIAFGLKMLRWRKNEEWVCVKASCASKVAIYPMMLK